MTNYFKCITRILVILNTLNVSMYIDTINDIKNIDERYIYIFLLEIKEKVFQFFITHNTFVNNLLHVLICRNI